MSPYLVERIRALLLDPPERRDRRGRRLPARPELMTFGQIGRRTLTFRATKGGTVVERETRLLEPLARDLRHWRQHSPRSGDDDLVFPAGDGGEWSGSDWDNWRDRIYKPAAHAVGLPDDTIPRDLRGSFASLLIFEGLNVLEVAPELGHSPATCLRYYARVFKEFDPTRRRPAEDVIREARELVATGAVPTEYPGAADATS